MLRTMVRWLFLLACEAILAPGLREAGVLGSACVGAENGRLWVKASRLGAGATGVIERLKKPARMWSRNEAFQRRTRLDGEGRL